MAQTTMHGPHTAGLDARSRCNGEKTVAGKAHAIPFRRWSPVRADGPMLISVASEGKRGTRKSAVELAKMQHTTFGESDRTAGHPGTGCP